MSEIIDDKPTKEQLSAIRRAKKALGEFKKLGLIAFAHEGSLVVHYQENFDNASNIDSGFTGISIGNEQVKSIEDLGYIAH